MSNFDFIGTIVEIVLWCIDCVREIIKNKQKNHDKDIEAEPKWGINNLPLDISEDSADHKFREVYFYIFTVSTNGELRVNSTEDMIKYLKIKGRVELCDHNRANEFTTTTTTTLAPGYGKHKMQILFLDIVQY